MELYLFEPCGCVSEATIEPSIDFGPGGAIFQCTIFRCSGITEVKTMVLPTHLEVMECLSEATEKGYKTFH